MTRRGAAVAASPVLGVPVASMSRMCASSSATGQCSAPLGTTNVEHDEVNPSPRIEVMRP